MSETQVSFITPALNEEKTIEMVLRAIRRECDSAALRYELIVVDNGSKDRTKEFALSNGARVLQCPKITIAAMRNLAVSQAIGTVLVFLDADVELGAGWGERVKAMLPKLAQDRLISGAPCTTPAALPAIFKWWFDGLALKANPRYIGTGHMILSSKFFIELGGFDSAKTTGEDYDICERAWAAGGVISPDLNLRAIHHGFPETIGEFVRRESWHGTSDFVSLKAFIKSTTAVAAGAFLLLVSLAIGVGLLGFAELFLLLITILLGLIYACAAAKFSGASFFLSVLNMPLMTAYLVGRAFSLVRVTLFGGVSAPKANRSAK
jgi:glycosyltransferase involved in cell wall biosynthesis